MHCEVIKIKDYYEKQKYQLFFEVLISMYACGGKMS